MNYGDSSAQSPGGKCQDTVYLLGCHHSSQLFLSLWRRRNVEAPFVNGGGWTCCRVTNSNSTQRILKARRERIQTGDPHLHFCFQPFFSGLNTPGHSVNISMQLILTSNSQFPATCASPPQIIFNPYLLSARPVLFCFVKLFRPREWRGAEGGMRWPLITGLHRSSAL